MNQGRNVSRPRTEPEGHLHQGKGEVRRNHALKKAAASWRKRQGAPQGLQRRPGARNRGHQPRALSVLPHQRGPLPSKPGPGQAAWEQTPVQQDT